MYIYNFYSMWKVNSETLLEFDAYRAVSPEDFRFVFYSSFSFFYNKGLKARQRTENRTLMACVLCAERWTMYSISVNKHSIDTNLMMMWVLGALSLYNFQAYNKSIFDLPFQADQFRCLRTLRTPRLLSLLRINKNARVLNAALMQQKCLKYWTGFFLLSTKCTLLFSIYQSKRDLRSTLIIAHHLSPIYDGFITAYIKCYRKWQSIFASWFYQMDSLPAHRCTPKNICCVRRTKRIIWRQNFNDIFKNDYYDYSIFTVFSVFRIMHEWLSVLVIAHSFCLQDVHTKSISI